MSEWFDVEAVRRFLDRPGFLPGRTQPMVSIFDDVSRVMAGLSIVAKGVSSRAAGKVALGKLRLNVRSARAEWLEYGSEQCVQGSAALMVRAGLSRDSIMERVLVQCQKEMTEWGSRSDWARVEMMVQLASEMVTALVSDRDRRGDLVDAAARLAAFASLWVFEVKEKESKK